LTQWGATLVIKIRERERPATGWSTVNNCGGCFDDSDTR
jgi:hypothetical protein